MSDVISTKAAPEALKFWRESQDPKLSFDAAGARIGVGGSTWFDWEAGKKVPTVDLAEDLEALTGGAVTVLMWAALSRERRLDRAARKAAGG